MIELGCCSMCGHDFDRESEADSRPWIVLNRYALGSGECERMVLISAREEDGTEGCWDIEDEEAEFSGALLCWPDCAVLWVNGQLLENETKASAEGD
jgi:hypothetical protein